MRNPAWQTQIAIEDPVNLGQITTRAGRGDAENKLIGATSTKLRQLFTGLGDKLKICMRATSGEPPENFPLMKDLLPLPHRAGKQVLNKCLREVCDWLA